MSLLQDAVAAFEQGEAARAVRMIAPLIGQPGDSRPALLLGEAARVAQDWQAVEQAAQWLLALDPASIRALVWQGDRFWALHDQRQAGRYYGAALNRAEGQAVPPALGAELDRISQRMAALKDRLIAFVDDWLSRHGQPPEARSERITRSIRILAGQDEGPRLLQKPTLHYVPGLPQIGWYETAGLDWVPKVEALSDAIRADLAQVMADEAAFAPYVQTDTSGPTRDFQGLGNNPDWGACYFWKDGTPDAANLARCPAVAEALSYVPQPRLAGRMPTAMFSRLKPGTHIPAHHGMLNARLIAHLPLIVPPDCAMRVGHETRAWAEGTLCLFDDSVEHEAWNHSNQTRVVLLFDVARPELEEREYEAIRLCFEAVDAYQ